MNDEDLRGATALHDMETDEIVAHLPAELTIVLGPKDVPSEVCLNNPATCTTNMQLSGHERHYGSACLMYFLIRDGMCRSIVCCC